MTIELTPGQAYINSDEGQRYSQFVRGHHFAQVSFSDDSEEIETDNIAKIERDFLPLTEANSVGSLWTPPDWSAGFGDYGKHKPVLDLDMDVLVVPSTTRGHHHLYIDYLMPWHDYSLLLKVLAHVGILQNGYMHASEARRESWLRTPWTRKGM